MPSASGFHRRIDPSLYAIAAIVSAAAVVLYLQNRALSELRHQATLVLREVAEQTADAIVTDMQRILEGPVFDTLTAVNHPQIQEGRLDLLAAEYERGLGAYPQVERFFVWTEHTDDVAGDEVLFYGAGHAGHVALPLRPASIPAAFGRDPALGHIVFSLAQQSAPSQQIYAAYEHVGIDGQHDAFLRLFWTDARRDRFFAVIGFIVDRQRLRDTFIPELYRRHLQADLQVRGEDLPLELRVSDEQGAVLWGSDRTPEMSARASLPMLFYPAHLVGSRLAAGVDPVNWTVEVSPVRPNRLLDTGVHGYWLPALSALLMLVALTFTIQAGRRAAAVARMQADFVSHVSHQLKTPLSLLSAATETVELDRVRSPEKLALYLGIIRTEVGRLSSLVQRILEFSAVQERRPLELDTVDLSALVRETVDAFQASLVGQHFAFHVVEDSPAPWVLADPAALEQVLANLLDNAVKYSDTIREVTVRVGWEGANAVIDVIDSGIGIANSDASRIFERFYRGSGRAGQRKGFGLGLAIARELVAAHRGSLELCETGPRGSTFRIWLPGATTVSPTRTRPTMEAAS